ncbi:MAG TPA: hypothetical protein VFS24_07155, partial [Steroidobacteraceae bacterium]|nr:hypothetical protein [Steroidobacteraceae bacterium]
EISLIGSLSFRCCREPAFDGQAPVRHGGLALQCTFHAASTIERIQRYAPSHNGPIAQCDLGLARGGLKPT